MKLWRYHTKCIFGFVQKMVFMTQKVALIGYHFALYQRCNNKNKKRNKKVWEHWAVWTDSVTSSEVYGIFFDFFSIILAHIVYLFKSFPQKIHQVLTKKLSLTVWCNTVYLYRNSMSHINSSPDSRSAYRTLPNIYGGTFFLK